MKKKIEFFIVKCVCKGIELYMRKYRLYKSYYEVIPMTEEEFQKELTEKNTEQFCESYSERFGKYRVKN